MKVLAVSFLAGALFGVGLLVSGMTNPAKVIGFLDFAGAWDPSLMLVMAGAIAVYLPAFRIMRRRDFPIVAREWQLPATAGIDARLIGGSALFGVGWGIAGLCPGPAIVSAGAALGDALVFVGAMALGSLAARALEPRAEAGAVATLAAGDG